MSAICLLTGLLATGPVQSEELSPPVGGAVLHTLENGQTVEELVRLYGAERSQILKVNGIKQLEGLQKLWIPPSPRGWPLHQVTSGETFWRVSKMYDIPVEHLKQANAQKDNRLMPGQVLILPRASVQARATEPQFGAQPRRSLASRGSRWTGATSSGWMEVRLPDNTRAWARTDSLVLGSWKPLAPDQLIDTARRFTGIRYHWGGIDPNGFDCSGYVQEVFRLCGYRVPRLADVQHKELVKVDKESLQKGDLVFFNTDGSGISHVGIYVEGNRFLHASSSRGVMESSLEENYYKTKFVGGARLPQWADQEAKKKPPSRFEDD